MHFLSGCTQSDRGAGTGGRFSWGWPLLGRRTGAALRAVLVLAVLTAVARRVAAAPADEDRRVDRAIARALASLAESQERNGSWRVDAYGESTAATSLAVMAFLAAGHIPGEGPYGATLDRAIAWVVDQQRGDGMLVAAQSHGPMYDHGISTLMLAEVAGMVDEPLATRCREALQRAVALILKAQAVSKSERHAGGWRYQSGSEDSDLSVTGWQVLALRAAKNVGCDVPAEAIDRAVAYVKRCAFSSGGFGYQPPHQAGGQPTATRTGTGILALEICGQHHTPEALRGAEYLRTQPLHPEDHYFFYGAYYCTVGLFQIGGRDWEEFRPSLQRTLLSMQRPDGSWLALTGGERRAGAPYATSMAVLALAVEYRFLPIYQR